VRSDEWRVASAEWRFLRSSLANRKSQIANLLGLFLALVSYWSPWVAHRDAGLAIAEVDLVEFPKFMPQYRADELFVWRESFYVPLLVLSIALVVWAAQKTNLRWLTRWLLRAVALFIPVTPSVFNVLESHEFQTQLNIVVVVVVLIALSPLLRRVPTRVTHAALMVAFTLAAMIPTAQFVLLMPALAQIYHEPISIGWGVWANLIGFALLAVAQFQISDSAAVL